MPIETNTLKTFSRTGMMAAIALALGIFLPSARASSIDAIYAFGDSLSDAGNIYAATAGAIPGAPYFNGQFTNGNVWVQDLASDLGLSPLAPSLLGGTDYAYGDGETGPTSFNTSPLGTDLLGPTGQIAQFSATHLTADPNALYTIWIGSNDVSDILASGPTPAQAAADLGIVAGNIDAGINMLASAGARNFLILTVPDLGDTPESLAAGPLVSATASALSAGFDGILVNGAGPVPSLSTLAAVDSVNISVLNTYSLVDAIVAHPTAFGFTNTTSPCYTGTYLGFADLGDPGTVCANPNQYLFWDGVHPTAAADALVATAAFNIAPAPEPGSLSLLFLGFFAILLTMRTRLRRKNSYL